ncbi:MAG: choice-of-anchor Q domain-containing protein, partial [Pirellulales bacterium]
MLAVTTWIVDNPIDELDGDFSSGNLSLREAIGQAAMAGDMIEFASSLDGATINLEVTDLGATANDMGINKSLTIDASMLAKGLTINAGSAPSPSRIFDISGPAQVQLKGLKLTNGDVSNITEMGGAIRSVGASLTITDSVITGNKAERGGGIYTKVDSTDKVLIQNSVISGNTANTNGGGVDAYVTSNPPGFPGFRIEGSTISGNTTLFNAGVGGGLALKVFSYGSRAELDNNDIVGNTVQGSSGQGGGLWVKANGEVTVELTNSNVNGNNVPGAGGRGGGISTDFFGENNTLKVISSVVSGNSVGNPNTGDGEGAGIYAYSYGESLGNDFEFIDSTISGNVIYAAQGDGGGLFAYLRGSRGTVTIRGTTIANNQVPGSGGGAFVCPKILGELEITNSTISGNQSGVNGGGLHLVGLRSNTKLFAALTNVTITDNTSDPALSGGGLYIQNLNLFSVNLHNTIISGNNDAGGQPNNIAGKPVAPGSSYSIVGSNGTGGVTPGINNNTVSDNPGLAPLADYGGPTLTHALLAGSLAIDAGHPDDIAGEVETFDLGGGVFFGVTIPDFDQRGAPFGRFVDGNGVAGAEVDIGAFELQGYGLAPPGDPPNPPRGYLQVLGVTVSGSASTHAPYKIPDGSGEQLRTVPVGNADTIRVVFDRAVGIANLLLVGKTDSQTSTQIFPDPNGFTSVANTATWTFPAAFAANMMELTIRDTTTDIEGNGLDGEWLDNVNGQWLGNPATIFDGASAEFPSGDGSEGGDFVFHFTI